ncbi:MAG: hypothetical protein HBSIN02_21580 [Bacteroidia bacterium]|nr:MAG: hypothetical protein HBSIN02_21580 [Bacteroidia bacterium]
MRLAILVSLLFAAHAAQAQSAADSIEAEKRMYLEAIAKQIAGNENKPAAEVFKNIKMMKDNTARRLLNIMNFGFSRSLGVGCTHCHVANDWANDEKATKNVAREMAAMVQTINQKLLPEIEGLRAKRPTVNCTTCHRGEVQPALSMPPR